MKISDFDYHLPQQLIAQKPPKSRHESRLLVLDKNLGKWEHKQTFSDIINLFKPGDVLVLNDTKVLKARLVGENKNTKGKIDALIISSNNNEATAMIQAGRRPKIGDLYNFLGSDFESYTAKVTGQNDSGWILNFDNFSVNYVMERIGLPPLPPYIKRKEKFACKEEDSERYQTVYAKNSGSIAAPTAGLHFTEQLLKAIKEKNVEIVYVTLHVGTATFLPVKSENVLEHKMHSEYYQISEESALKINLAIKEGRRVIATGTTSCRTLESAGKSGYIEAGSGKTDIFIYPGFSYKIVKGLITNFHLPKSTLILLVSAFVGKDLIFKVYQDAINNKYRFYSYGDAMFIF